MRTRIVVCVVLALAAAATLLVTVTASAGRVRAAGSTKNLAWQEVGPDTIGGGCANAAIQSTAGKMIGTETLCGENFSMGPAGDGIYTGHATYAFADGSLKTTFTEHVQTISPFTSGPLALPPAIEASASQWIEFVGDHTITGGTKRYANAKGSIRETGFFVTDSGNLAIWGNSTDIATVKSNG